MGLAFQKISPPFMRERRASGKGLRGGGGLAPPASSRKRRCRTVLRCVVATCAECPHTGLRAGMCRPEQRLKEQHVSTGTVKWFNETKGYGFITPDQGGSDVFVHISAVERSGMRGLNEGQKISYDLEADRKTGKSSAVNLKTA
jgi:CspA family cold shock protein